MHIRDLLPFHAMRTSVIRPRVELSLTSRAAPNWTAVFHLNRTAAVLPNWTAAVHLNRTAAVLLNRMANSRRPWGIAVWFAVLSRQPGAQNRLRRTLGSAQTAPLSHPRPHFWASPNRRLRASRDLGLRASLCRAFSLRPRLTLACPSALVPVKATPTKPPARFPRGL